MASHILRICRLRPSRIAIVKCPGPIGDTSARAAFVVGKDGVVKYAEQTPTPKDLPNFAAVKAALAK